MTSEYPVRQTGGRGMGDEVVYARRPFLTRDGEKAANAGWITWIDTLSGTKLHDYQTRGFTVLNKYGKINSVQRERALENRLLEGEVMTPRQYDAEYIWGPILRHKDGPAEFPLEQILEMRWYEARNCPIKDMEPARLFPQLRGHKVKHYQCPQCSRYFAEVDGVGATRPLANHLRIMHEWDMANILNYGKAIGIDFAAVEFGTGGPTELTFGDEDEPLGEVCDDCGETFFGKTGKARLAKHVKETHPAFELETV
jgi:hypothetical protein